MLPLHRFPILKETDEAIPVAEEGMHHRAQPTTGEKNKQSSHHVAIMNLAPE